MPEFIDLGANEDQLDFPVLYTDARKGIAKRAVFVLFELEGLSTQEIAELVKAVAPKPINVLVSRPSETLSVARLTDLGVRRISVGSALACVAWAAFIRAAREIAESGTFDSLSGAVPFADINGAFDQRN